MQKRSETTRARLLDAALKQFAVSGYDATSVDEICELASVSKGAFYHHFESKQALFLSLLNSWLEVIDENLGESRQGTVPEMILAMTEVLPGILATASQQLPMFLEFWTQASRDQKVWEASIEPYQHFRGYFATLIKRGIKEGSFKKDVNPQIAGQVVLSLAVGILLQALLEPEGADWEKTATQGVEMLMRGMSR